MKQVKRSWDLLTDEQRQTAIKYIIGFFSTERSEVVGIVAAEALLDMFLQAAGPAIYNSGVEATRRYLQDRVEETNLEIEVSLKKSI